MDNLDFILTFFLTVTYAMIGLCLGSFASAIAYRIAHQKSWVVDLNSKSGTHTPARSSCPSCHHQLAALDLVPVFSWVFLKGKCRYCHAKISSRYPVIESCGAAAMVLFLWSGGGAISLLAFVITLPFCLAFLLMITSKSEPPFYLYGLFFSNVFVLLYAVIWTN